MPEQAREQIFGAELSAARAAANSVASSAPSNVATFKPRADQTDFDVIIVGAGLSGIEVAYHLQRDCPRKSFVILEARGAIGGTWDLFRFPGIRSDSDMHTLGSRFRPWRGEKAIADGPSILDYLNNTAREYGIDRKIRYHHKVKRASWSSTEARWTLEVQGPGGKTLTYTCNFLQMCSGYYDYDAPATCPDGRAWSAFSNVLRFELAGSNVGVTVVHPGGVATRIAENARRHAGATNAEVAQQLQLARRVLTMPPAKAGEIVVRAVERRAPRVVVGGRTKMMAVIERLAPVSYWKILGPLAPRP